MKKKKTGARAGIICFSIIVVVLFLLTLSSCQDEKVYNGTQEEFKEFTQAKKSMSEIDNVSVTTMNIDSCDYIV